MRTGSRVGSPPRVLRLLVAVAATLAAALATTVPATAQAPVGDVVVERIDGGPEQSADVRATAVRACQANVAEEGAAPRVLLARDDAFADALAAAPLAGTDGCILFTGAGEAPLDPRVRAEIDRALAPGGTVVLLGGGHAVGDQVAAELAAAGLTVERLEGPTRYETAARVAEVVRDAAEPGGFTEVILAFGGNWPDVVTAGAYAAAQGVPIVLTPSDTLHPEAAAFLQAAPVDRTTVVGGTAVIAEQVAAATPNAERVAGDNRMGTAAMIARSLWPTAPTLTGVDFTLVNLEHEDGWALALAAAPLSASRGAPQLGVRQGGLPSETAALLDEIGTVGLEAPPTITVIGDEAAVPPAVASEAATHLGGAPVPPPGSCNPDASTAAPEPPAEATRVEQVLADLDGDGQPDQLTTYAVDDAGAATFHLHVRLATGYATDRALDADSIADVRPLGTAVIGEGRPVAFVVEQAGAGVVNVALFGLHEWDDDPCELGRVTIADPDLAPQLPVGNGHGLQCRDVDDDAVPELVVREAVPADADGTTWEWTEAAYRWSGAGALRTVTVESGTFTLPGDDDRLEAFSTLDCPGVESP